jgi:autophagy-related protein 9
MVNKGIIDHSSAEIVEKILYLVLFTTNWGHRGILDLSLNQVEWTSQLVKKSKLIGFLSILLMPFICIIYIVYVILRYSGQIKDNPNSLLSSHKWSPFSQLKLREINEAQHSFETRLRRAHYHAREYVEQFPANSTIIIIARACMFATSILLLILFIMSFMSGQFIFQIGPFSSMFYMTIFMTIIGGCRALLPNDEILTTPEAKMRDVIKYTHYSPKKWYNREHTDTVYKEFTLLFDYKIKLWLIELWNVIILPYTCIVILPKKFDKIVAFMMQYTAHHHLIGNVCLFTSMSDLSYCSPKYGGDCYTPKETRLKNGKMEKSILNFHINHPTWVIPDAVKNLLTKVQEWETHEHTNGMSSNIFLSVREYNDPLYSGASLNLTHYNYRNQYNDNV